MNRGAYSIMNSKIRNENSPLEEIMEAALKRANIKYKAQYTVYDGNKDKWNARYILDFLVYGEFCKIGVECDGNTYHGFLEAKEKDLRRDIWIKRLGFDDTLRFNTEQIKYNLDGCIKQIKKMIQTYDKIKYDKRKKFLFDHNRIPSIVPKKEAEYIYKGLSSIFQEACNTAHVKVKITNRKKKFIISSVRRAIFEAGYAEISDTLAFFNNHQLINYRHYIDILFGAYNIPCSIIVAATMKDVNIPEELANNPTVLKIIILYVTPSKSFKGKSFIVLNGTINGNKIIQSDLVKFSKENSDANQYKILIKEAEELEKSLKKVYQKLYNLNHFRKSLVVSPFLNIDKDMYEKIIISIKQFVLSRKVYLNDSVEALDIAADWMKSEGVYFKDVSFTLHEVSLTVQYFRNKMTK